MSEEGKTLIFCLQHATIDSANSLLNNMKRYDDKDQLRSALNTKNEHGYTPLNALLASNKYNGKEEQRVELYEKLMVLAEIAFGQNNSEMLNFLTEPNKFGYTPLMSVVRQRDYTIANKLLQMQKECFGNDCIKVHEHLMKTSDSGHTMMSTHYKNKNTFPRKLQQHKHITADKSFDSVDLELEKAKSFTEVHKIALACASKVLDDCGSHVDRLTEETSRSVAGQTRMGLDNLR